MHFLELATKEPTMTGKRNWLWAACLFCGLLMGCGGGASLPAAGGGDIVSLPQEQLVVQVDLNGDEEPDLITLDTTEQPFMIVEAIYGSAAGDPVDATDLLFGTAFDSALSTALADYLAQSFGGDERMEMDVADAFGAMVTLVVFE